MGLVSNTEKKKEIIWSNVQLDSMTGCYEEQRRAKEDERKTLFC